MYEFIRASKKCLPDSIDLLLGNDNLVIEEKYDGSRFGANIHVGSPGISMMSRNYIDRAVNVPYITSTLGSIFPPNTILDGEIVHLHEARNVRWEMARSVMGTKDFNPEVTQAHYLIYDIQMLNGESLKDTKLKYRRDLLKKFFNDNVNHIGDTFLTRGCLAMPRAWKLSKAKYDELWKHIVEDNAGEGVMIKDLEESKYAKSWTKVKKNFTIDAFVVGVEKGKGKFEGQIGSLVLATLDNNGSITEIGKCSGMTDQERRELTNMAVAGTIKGIVVEVGANEVTKNLKLRHPNFVRVRYDKPKDQCFLSQLTEQLK